MTEWITQIDFSVLYAIQDTLRCAWLDLLMPVITRLGDAGIIWLPAAGILLLIPRDRGGGMERRRGATAQGICTPEKVTPSVSGQRRRYRLLSGRENH